MKKPLDYDVTAASSSHEKILLGGHKMIIRRVIETKSKTGKDMIVMEFDFAFDDTQPNYFMNQYIANMTNRSEWPYQGRYYILVSNRDGKCNPGFKTFTTCVEHSNPGFVTQWGDTFCEQFKRKFIGGVFGIVEEEYNGQRKKRTKLRWLISVDKVSEAKVPEEKLLSQPSQSIYPNYQTDANGFMNIPDGIDEELPFN